MPKKVAVEDIKDFKNNQFGYCFIVLMRLKLIKGSLVSENQNVFVGGSQIQNPLSKSMLIEGKEWGSRVDLKAGFREAYMIMRIGTLHFHFQVFDCIRWVPFQVLPQHEVFRQEDPLSSFFLILVIEMLTSYLTERS